MEGQLHESSNDGLYSEKSDKESNFSKRYDEEHILRKESSLGSIFIEQIQSLIANVVKDQLGEDIKIHTCT